MQRLARLTTPRCESLPTFSEKPCAGTTTEKAVEDIEDWTVVADDNNKTLNQAATTKETETGQDYATGTHNEAASNSEGSGDREIYEISDLECNQNPNGTYRNRIMGQQKFRSSNWREPQRMSTFGGKTLLFNI